MVINILRYTQTHTEKDRHTITNILLLLYIDKFRKTRGSEFREMKTYTVKALKRYLTKNDSNISEKIRPAPFLFLLRDLKGKDISHSRKSSMMIHKYTPYVD